jgi:PAS domain S-box-containing protein
MAVPHPATILYVDDDELSRRAMQGLLRRAGFEVKEAATGSEALRLATERPDIVLLDVNLPDISGFEVCRQIKAHPATQAIPVLHLSALFVSSEDRTHGLEGGADAYLTKPVEPKELIAHLKAMLRIRRAEEETRLVARQWQATFDAISDGVCLLDRHGQIQRCNLAMERLVAQSGTQLAGQTYSGLFPEWSGKCEGDPFQRMLASRRRETTEVARGERWLHITADPIVDETQALMGAVYLLSDVTDRKRLEEQLRQAQKIQAIGQLAGGVAHDFNNLLTAILGNVSLLLEEESLKPATAGLVKTIERAGLRAAELTRQLLGFARQNLLWLKPLHLETAIGEMVAMLRCTIDPRILVEVQCEPDLWLVRADANQINQVLLNLCLNARDAMPEGGRLLLETRNVEVDSDFARQHLESRTGAFVRLRVQDTGHGIPPAIQSRIFEPFFTTKEPGQGTGLGLAMVFGIVKQHQGWIECVSAVTQGAAFDVYLPRCGTEEGPSLTPAPPSARHAGSGTILVVDDEGMVRDLCRLILQRAGYEVLEAADGHRAVTLYQQEQARIDLVLLDLTMPHLSGRDTLRQIRELNPAVRVLIASGYSTEDTNPAGLEGVVGIIPKPYRQADLLQRVRAALESDKPNP